MRILERLPRETGRDYALRVLKDNIIRMELVPGSMVSENELATQMGLSRTPVREALIELSKVKIVEIYPQRGSAVALIDYSLVEESRYMRNVLESAIVELLCATVTAEQLERLEENVRLQEFYLQGRQPEKLLELDNEFHRMLFQMTNKMQIYSLMNSIMIHFDRVRNLWITAVKDVKTVADHQKLLEAIRTGDAALARQLMNEHLTRHITDEAELREKYPTYFK